MIYSTSTVAQATDVLLTQLQSLTKKKYNGQNGVNEHPQRFMLPTPWSEELLQSWRISAHTGRQGTWFTHFESPVREQHELKSISFSKAFRFYGVERDCRLEKQKVSRVRAYRLCAMHAMTCISLSGFLLGRTAPKSYLACSCIRVVREDAVRSVPRLLATYLGTDQWSTTKKKKKRTFCATLRRQIPRQL